jgi:hypothetical protein
MTKEIILTNGGVALVDDEDYEKVSKYTWHLRKDGYAGSTQYCGGGRNGAKYKTIRMHRLILDAKDGEIIDHINGNRLDNRKCNLIIVTRTENTYNKKLDKRNTSGYRGVTWRKDLSKWKATIQKDGKLIHLGYFDDKHEAARAYNKKAMELYGEYARLNDIRMGV